MPEPKPLLVWIRTTEGPTSWTSLTYSDCSSRVAVLAGAVLEVALGGAPVPALRAVIRAAASAAAAASAMERLDLSRTLDISYLPGIASESTRAGIHRVRALQDIAALLAGIRRVRAPRDNAALR